MIGIVCMADERERVDRLLIDEHVHLDQIRGFEADMLVIQRSIAARERLELVVEFDDELSQRQVVNDSRAFGSDVVEVEIDAAFVLTELHHLADVVLRCVHSQTDHRLLNFLDVALRRKIRGTMRLDHLARLFDDAINNVWRCRHKMNIKFPFKPLTRDIHVKKSQEAAAETEAQCRRRFRIIRQRSVVELELFQGITQLRKIVALHRIQSAVHDRFDRLIARQRLFRRIGSIRHGVADAGFIKSFDARCEIADLAGAEPVNRGPAGREDSNFLDRVGGPSRHHLHDIARFDRPVHQADVADDAAVIIVHSIKDQCLERRVVAPLGMRDAGNDLFEDVRDAGSFLGAAADRFGSVNADHVLDFMPDLLGTRRRQIDLVQHGQNSQVIVDGLISICQRLRLHALRGVDDEQSAFAGRKRPRDFVAEVDMPGRIDQVEDVVFAVLGFVVHAHGNGLDRDPAFALDIHVVEDLLFHVAFCDRASHFQKTVSNRRLAMVDVRDNREIAYFSQISCHSVSSFPHRGDGAARLFQA